VQRQGRRNCSQIRKKAAEAAFFKTLVGCKLQAYYVFRLRTFLALSYGELNLLAFCQSLESAALDGAVVNENVRAAFASNKAKTFGFVEKLNSTGNSRHIYNPELNHFNGCLIAFVAFDQRGVRKQKTRVIKNRTMHY